MSLDQLQEQQQSVVGSTSKSSELDLGHEDSRTRLPSTTELTNALGIPSKAKSRRTWSPEEDEKLRLLVAYWGDQCGRNGHWDKISSHLVNRTNKDCRKRWFHSLDPKLKRGRWTPHEDKVLLEAYQKLGPSWHKISQLIPGRTDDQCSKRYNDVLDPNISERLRAWEPEEDKKLLELVQKYSTKWRLISKEMEGRTGLTCRNRWRKLVSPVVKERVEHISKAEEDQGRSLIDNKSSRDLRELSAAAVSLQQQQLLQHQSGNQFDGLAAPSASSGAITINNNKVNIYREGLYTGNSTMFANGSATQTATIAGNNNNTVRNNNESNNGNSSNNNRTIANNNNTNSATTVISGRNVAGSLNGNGLSVSSLAAGNLSDNVNGAFGGSTTTDLTPMVALKGTPSHPIDSTTRYTVSIERDLPGPQTEDRFSENQRVSVQEGNSNIDANTDVNDIDNETTGSLSATTASDGTRSQIPLSFQELQSLVELASKVGQKLVVHQHNYYYNYPDATGSHSSSSELSRFRVDSNRFHRPTFSNGGMSGQSPSQDPIGSSSRTSLAPPTPGFLELELMDMAEDAFDDYRDSDLPYDVSDYHGIPFNPS